MLEVSSLSLSINSAADRRGARGDARDGSGSPLLVRRSERIALPIPLPNTPLPIPLRRGLPLVRVGHDFRGWLPGIAGLRSLSGSGGTGEGDHEEEAPSPLPNELPSLAVVCWYSHTSCACCGVAGPSSLGGGEPGRLSRSLRATTCSGVFHVRIAR